MRLIVDLEKNGSKAAVSRALVKLGVEAEAKTLQKKIKAELMEFGESPTAARTKSWEPMIRRFLPQDIGLELGVYKMVDENMDPITPPKPEPAEDNDEEEGESFAGFGVLPADWPELPKSAPWVEELEWAYQNGFFVISTKSTGAIVYRYERARTPAPSQGALVMMTLLAEHRNKFMDLLGKAKSGADGGDSEIVKKEKKRIGAMQDILQRFVDNKEPSKNAD